MGHTSLGDLVTAAAGGDEDAWRAITDRFASLVWSVARSFHLDDAQAADVSQVTWLRLVEHLDRLSEPERVGAWLVTTARRECLRTLRQRDRSWLTSDGNLTPAAADLPPPEHGVVADERSKLLWEALGKTSLRCQQLLRVLMADPPPSYEEVAAALDMPIGSIGPTRARCLAHLRGHLEGAGITDDRPGSV